MVQHHFSSSENGGKYLLRKKEVSLVIDTIAPAEKRSAEKLLLYKEQSLHQ